MSFSKHVLILEDDNQLSRLYEKAIVHAGFRTLRVSSVLEAVANLVKFDPDMVCLDWNLGEETSAAFLDHLLTLDPANMPQLMVISGEPILYGIEDYQHLISKYLVKPVNLAQLILNVQLLTEASEGRLPLRAIRTENLAPGVIKMSWDGYITMSYLVEHILPTLTEQHTLICDIQELNAGRFTLGIVEQEAVPVLSNLRRVYMIHEPEADILARTLAEALQFGGICSYHTSYDEVVAEVLEV